MSLDFELLKALHERIEGSEIPESLRFTEQLIWRCRDDWLLITAVDDEYPDASFWMLDRIQESYSYPSLSFCKSKEGEVSYICDDEVTTAEWGLGTTRTEAIARLFVAIMPVLQKIDTF